MEYQNEVFNPEDSRLNLKEFIIKYISYWPLFLASLAIAIVSAKLYLRYTVPLYSVRSALLIKDENRGLSGGGGGTYSDIMLFKNRDNVQNEIQILKSRVIMARVVDALSLNTSYYSSGNIKTSNIYTKSPFRLEAFRITDSARSFTYKIDFINPTQFRINESKANTYTINQPFETTEGRFKMVPTGNRIEEETQYKVLWTPSMALGGSYSNNLKINPVNMDAAVLDISMTIDNAELGKAILNQLMIEYDQATIEDKNQTAKKTLDFIDERIHIIENELDSVENVIKNFRTSKEFFDEGIQLADYSSKSSTAQTQVFQEEGFLRLMQFLDDYLRNPKNLFEKVPSTLGIEDPTLAAKVAYFNRLVEQRQVQLLMNTPQAPKVKSLEITIEAARGDILESLTTLKKTHETVRDELMQKDKEFQSKISSVPAKQKEYMDISRQQRIKEELYLFLRQKKEETAITLASTISNSRIVESASGGGSPISPKNNNVYALALLLGLLIPTALIYLMELLNDKVTTRNDVSKVTEAPIMGEIGHADEKDFVLVAGKTRSSIAEQFRIIRTNLQYVFGTVEKPVIMVTSSFSGEGKSFVTTNLGGSFSLTGKRTILLEFDLRKPKIATGLGLGKLQGITHFMLGKANLDDLIVKVPEVENLYVLPCGVIPPNPAELILSPKLAEMFDYLKKNFDIIVVDTAPVGLVSDAMTLRKYADCTLYIVRQRHTYKKQLHLVNEMYTLQKLPRLTVLINDIRTGGVYGYYGGAYNYGYGYGYGYYGESSTRKGWRKWKANILNLFKQ
jgi:capsular exopolysaccharide synthesis family protein